MAKKLPVVTTLFKVACGVLYVAFTLHAVGFSTPTWMLETVENSQEFRTGLWQHCWKNGSAERTCTNGAGNNSTMQDWFRVVQTFEVLGLACLVTAVIISVTLLTVVSNQRLARVDVYICVFAGIFIVVGTGTFTWMTKFKLLGYSCWLVWTSSLVLTVTIILFEYDHNRKSSALRKGSIDLSSVEEGQSGDRSPRLPIHHHRRHSDPLHHSHNHWYALNKHHLTGSLHLLPHHEHQSTGSSPTPSRSSSQQVYLVSW